MKTQLFSFVILFLLAAKSFGQANCTAASTGFTPINDLGSGTFTNAWSVTWTGGLYPNGSNYLPATHKGAGTQIAQQVLPLNSSGNVDMTNGKIVWMSIGMSNTTYEAQQFIPLANAYANKNPKLTLVDGAQGGMSADRISSPWLSQYSTYWSTVATRLSSAGVTANQVEVIWFKEADPAGTMTVQIYYDSLIVQFKRIMHEIKTRFPNAKLCYMASRISARYASSTLNPEPFAYYTGWAVKEIIEEQINGDTALAYSGSNIRSPFLSWGIYMWSDGSTPEATNSNIFITCPTDLQNDGTHPSIPTGAAKVANWLLTFYQNDSLSCSWFFNSSPSFCPLTAVNEISLENGISVYPNPTSGKFQISNLPAQAGLKSQISNLEIYNVLGECIYKSLILNPKSLIDLSSQPSGIYFLKVMAGKNSFDEKIIIQK
ncbi:MAG: T9SS type A sorting domain-containing protein [Bacteroidetes bacterium]|nr:T9SS type A sorting domain-containing protein [Bacteroidota bacterium]